MSFELEVGKGILGFAKNLIFLNEILDRIKQKLCSYETILLQLQKDAVKQSEQIKAIPVIVENIFLKR